MKSINIREARQQLSDLVNEAEHGQSIRITRHGREVAQVGPVDKSDGAALPDLSDFRKSLESSGKALSKIVIKARDEARY